MVRRFKLSQLSTHEADQNSAMLQKILKNARAAAAAGCRRYPKSTSQYRFQISTLTIESQKIIVIIMITVVC